MTTYSGTKKYVCIAEALVKHKPDTTLVDNAGNTALHLAALNLNNSIFELLLKEGSSIAIKNRQQKTPIDLRIDAMKRQGKWRTFILVAIGTACPVATILTFSSLPFIAAIFNVPEYIMYIITALSLLSAFAVIWGKYEINVIKYGKSAQQSLQLQVRKISTETVLRECKELEADFKTEANYDDSTLINKVTQLSERLKLTLSNDYFDPYHFKKRQLMRNPADWATRRDKVCTLFSTIGSFFAVIAVY
ncbi:MAG: ankyrin repeat domain-containing protein [Coxiellaceae bacterium]|nr:MAG: ankyrin repeat domain-containing protein [Coxiellaceae bacterium]